MTSIFVDFAFFCRFIVFLCFFCAIFFFFSLSYCLYVCSFCFYFCAACGIIYKYIFISEALCVCAGGGGVVTLLGTSMQD